MSITGFRRALRSARQSKGWTAKQAAEAIGLPVDTYKSYERQSGRVPPIDLTKAIVDALGPEPINALLEGSGHVCQRNGKAERLMMLGKRFSEEYLAEMQKHETEE